MLFGSLLIRSTSPSILIELFAVCLLLKCYASNKFGRENLFFLVKSDQFEENEIKVSCCCLVEHFLDLACSFYTYQSSTEEGGNKQNLVFFFVSRFLFP